MDDRTKELYERLDALFAALPDNCREEFIETVHELNMTWADVTRVNWVRDARKRL